MGRTKFYNNTIELIKFRRDDRLMMIFYGAVVGILSGFAAIFLNFTLDYLYKFFLAFRHYWWIIFFPGFGAVFSIFLMKYIFKDGPNHGVPEVIYCVSRYRGLLRLRSVFSRLITGAINIGSGGSAGPESPIIMAGSAIGSNISQWFSLNGRQRITLVGCGAAGALAGIFNAPITGMVFAMEVILEEWKTINIVPIAIASVLGAKICRIFKGNQLVFSMKPFELDMTSIFASTGLIIFSVAASLILIIVLRQCSNLSNKTPFSPWLFALVAGTIVGVIGCSFPEVLGEGYHSVQYMIDGIFAPGIMLAALAAIFKILATALTLGSSTPGGIFAPCLVIGSFMGLTYHRIISHLFPSVKWVNEGCFALLGMAGLISGVVQAPLTAIFLIIEITIGYDIVIPLVIVSVITATLCNYLEPASFYFKELMDKGQLLRPGTDARILSELQTRELIEKDCILVKENMLLRDFTLIIKKSKRNYFPVVKQHSKKYIGMIYLNDIRPYLFNEDLSNIVFLGQIASRHIVTVDIYDELPEIIRKMDDNNLFSVPVVVKDIFIGMISKGTILDRYRQELLVQTL